MSRSFLAALLTLGFTLLPTLTLPGIPTVHADLLFADPAFAAQWNRVDRPVAAGAVTRTWLWGPAPLTGPLSERYQESPDRTRLVQYFDKGRMELTHPDADPSSAWYVTGGLLSRELISGSIQIGDALFLKLGLGAAIPVAGDPDNAFPTYADLASIIDQSQPDRTGTLATAWLTPDGWRSYDEAASDQATQFVQYIQYSGPVGEPVGYNIPRAFWEFMNQPGLVWEDDHQDIASPLFDWLFVLGYPLADPFWVQVRLRGNMSWILIQPFERRILTYTPSNPPGWQVEMSNIGQHYFLWRYSSTPPVRITGNPGFYGLAPGTRATFATSTRLDEIWEVSGLSRRFVAGSELIMRGELRGGSRWFTYWSITEEGLALAGWDRYTRAGTFIETVLFWPALHLFSLADLTPGSTKQKTVRYLSTRVSPHLLTVEIEVDEQVLVGTPYGLLPSWRLTIRASDDPPLLLSYLNGTVWFTPNIGIVQWSTNQYTAQLRTFTPPS